jgi:hypothetical protein
MTDAAVDFDRSNDDRNYDQRESDNNNKARNEWTTYLDHIFPGRAKAILQRLKAVAEEEGHFYSCSELRGLPVDSLLTHFHFDPLDAHILFNKLNQVVPVINRVFGYITPVPSATTALTEKNTIGRWYVCLIV